MNIRPFPPTVREATVEYLIHLDNDVFTPVYHWHPENRREHTRRHHTSYQASVAPIRDRIVVYRWESDGISARITVSIGPYQSAHVTFDWHEQAPWYPLLPDIITPWATALEKATGIDTAWTATVAT